MHLGSIYYSEVHVRAKDIFVCTVHIASNFGVIFFLFLFFLFTISSSNSFFCFSARMFPLFQEKESLYTSRLLVCKTSWLECYLAFTLSFKNSSPYSRLVSSPPLSYHNFSSRLAACPLNPPFALLKPRKVYYCGCGYWEGERRVPARTTTPWKAGTIIGLRIVNVTSTTLRFATG